MRLWATVLLVLSVLFVVVGILVTVFGEDPTVGAAGALFFTACAINFAVMRLDASKGEKWWSLALSLGRTPARTTALVISFIFWIGAGVLPAR